MNMNMQRGIFTALVTALGSAGVTGVAVAQTGASRVLEEIVVTSRRYEESIQDAPLAVAVMSEDYLRAQKVVTTEDILELSPGGVWNKFAKAQPGANIRGHNSFAPGNSSLDASMPTVIDGIPIVKPYAQLPAIFDIERVEVMRGPQGTTFGRNAAIGLIHFISARPSQDFDAAVNVSIGDRDRTDVDFFINGALSDTVSGRVAFNYDDQDGVMEDLLTGAALDNNSNTSIRGSLLFEPNDNFTAYVKLEYGEDDDLPVIRRAGQCVAPIIQTAGGVGGGYALDDVFGPGTVDWTESCDIWKTLTTQGVAGARQPSPLGLDRTILNATAELVWNVGDDMTLTWLSGYIDAEHNSVQDAFGTVGPINTQTVRNDGDSFTQEVRLDNTASDSRARWVIGGFYLEDDETRFEENLFCPGCPSVVQVAKFRPESHARTISTTNGDSLGLFGEISFDLTDELTLAIGGRYSEDSKDYQFTFNGWGREFDVRTAGLNNPDTSRECASNIVVDPVTGMNICGSAANPMGFDATLSDDWDDFSAKLSLSYAINDTQNIYFLYSEAYKPGGFQHDSKNLSHLSARVDVEEVENYEIGWKGATSRARYAVTLFDMENFGAQINTLIPEGGGFTTGVKNAGGIASDGIELEGTFLLSDNFELGGSIASISSELVNAVIGTSIDPLTGEVIGTDISGFQPDHQSDLTYVIYGSYTIDLAGGSVINLRADVRHRDEVWRRLNDRTTLLQDGTLSALSPSYDRWGLRIGWTAADGRTNITLWGKNLGDEFDFVNLSPGTPNTIGSFSTRAYNGREDYGVDFSYNFGN